MVLSSYAKINLTLKVNNKGKNNLHEIQTYFCLIDLKDKIKLIKTKEKKDKVFFNGPFSKLVNKSNNTVLNLLKFLRNLKLIKGNYFITVTKNIPVSSGLGGGTGNAACIIKYLFKKKINNKLLNSIEGKIGSDLKIFFHNQGFLKSLSSIIDFKKKQRLYFVLIQPNIRCSTKEVYSKVKKYSKKRSVVKNKLRTGPKFISFISRSNNDLQSIVEKKYPIIKDILKGIRKERGCCFSRMTGSGSVCYGLFNDEISAKKALNNLKKKYPKFWLSFAKTI